MTALLITPALAEVAVYALCAAVAAFLVVREVLA